MMLEKQKRWYCEKKEKVAKWTDEHKFLTGYLCALGVLCVSHNLVNKVFEPKGSGIVIRKSKKSENGLEFKTYTYDRFDNHVGTYHDINGETLVDLRDVITDFINTYGQK